MQSIPTGDDIDRIIEEDMADRLNGLWLDWLWGDDDDDDDDNEEPFKCPDGFIDDRF